MAMIYLKGDVSARLVQDRLPVAAPGAPNVPWLELLVGSETSADFVRIFLGTPEVIPDKLDALASQLLLLGEQERTRRVEVLKKRQNLREDHRGEVSGQAVLLDSGGVSAAIPMPPPEDAV